MYHFYKNNMYPEKNTKIVPPRGSTGAKKQCHCQNEDKCDTCEYKKLKKELDTLKKFNLKLLEMMEAFLNKE